MEVQQKLNKQGLQSGATNKQGSESGATPAPSPTVEPKQEPQDDHQTEEDEATIKERKRLEHNARVRFDRKIHSCLT